MSTPIWMPSSPRSPRPERQQEAFVREDCKALVIERRPGVFSWAVARRRLWRGHDGYGGHGTVQFVVDAVGGGRERLSEKQAKRAAVAAARRVCGR